MNYEEGKMILGVEELIDEMARGNLIFLHGQPKSPSFIINMKFATVLKLCQYGYFSKAKRIKSVAQVPILRAREQREIYLRLEATRVRMMNPGQRLGYWVGLTWRVLVGKERLM